MHGCVYCGLFALAFSISLCTGEQLSKEDVAKKIWGHIYIYNYNLFDGDNSSPQSFSSSDRQKVSANLVKKLWLLQYSVTVTLPEEGNIIECCQCSEKYLEKCEKYGKRKRLIGCVKDPVIVDTSKGEIKEHFSVLYTM